MLSCKKISTLIFSIGITTVVGCEQEQKNTDQEGHIQAEMTPAPKDTPKSESSLAKNIDEGSPPKLLFKSVKSIPNRLYKESDQIDPNKDSPFPHDQLPTDITAERDSSRVPNPLATVEPKKENPQPIARPVSGEIYSDFGPCRDQDSAITGVVLTEDFHYDFEAGAEGWNVDGVYETGESPRRKLPGDEPSLNTHPEGSISYVVREVDHFNNIESESVYTDFVSPNFGNEDQSWRKLSNYQFQAQMPPVTLLDGEPFPQRAEFLAQLRVEVEKCDGTISHFWDADENGAPNFCELQAYPTNCAARILLPEQDIRSVKKMIVRIYRPYHYTYDDGRVALFDFKGVN